MKKIIFCIALTVITLTSCNHNSNKNSQTVSQIGNLTNTTSTIEETKNKVSINSIVNAYLQLKNAFTIDNSIAAAKAGSTLETIFKNFDKSVFTVAQKKVFEDVVDDAREHAEHIGKNGGNITHQREHFELLSKDIYDLIKTFGGGQVLYKDFDPMYNKGKGAFWISETKEIINPYMGKTMSGSGTITEIIK